MTALALLDPCFDLEAEYLAMAAEFLAAGEPVGHQAAALAEFAAFLRRVQAEARAENLPPGYVPMNSYWLALPNRTIVGESRLRHYLTPALEIIGGHIGYAIRPACRRQGFGTAALALTLEKARQRGLSRVLVTCDTANLGSARIIEKNGGRLENITAAPDTGVPVSCYWIDL